MLPEFCHIEVEKELVHTSVDESQRNIPVTIDRLSGSVLSWVMSYPEVLGDRFVHLQHLDWMEKSGYQDLIEHAS